MFHLLWTNTCFLVRTFSAFFGCIACNFKTPGFLCARLVTNPCVAKGTNRTIADTSTVGSSDYDSCKSYVSEIIDTSVPCFQGDRNECSFLGVYQPPVQEKDDSGSSQNSTLYYAFSGFGYSWRFLGLPPRGIMLQELENGATEICNLDWAGLNDYNAKSNKKPTRTEVIL